MRNLFLIFIISTSISLGAEDPFLHGCKNQESGEFYLITMYFLGANKATGSIYSNSSLQNYIKKQCTKVVKNNNENLIYTGVPERFNKLILLRASNLSNDNNFALK